MSQAEPRAQVLIVDDNSDFRTSTAMLGRTAQCAITGVGSLREARRVMHTKPFDLMMLDLTLPDGCGLDLLEEVDLAQSGHIAVVTGNPSVETAIRAVRAPVIDYLVKPIDPSVMSGLLDRAREHARLRPRVAGSECAGMVGQSPAMKEVFQQLRSVAPLDVGVLLFGESGTGKELAARALHEFSTRQGPFVAVNCGAVAPELLSSQLFGHERGSFTGAVQSHPGFFEQAQGGTLFLDEITEMPPALQVYLLRVLESRSVTRVGGTKEIPVDVRLVAASSRDPERAVADGVLRADLYYRLAEFPIRLPPLRERGGDVALLAQRFLDRLNERYNTRKLLSTSALRELSTQSWPGNVRELRNAIQRAYVLAYGDTLEPQPGPNLAPAEADDGSVRFRVGMTFEDIERQMLLKTLAHFRHNKRQAARALGITTKTIYNRLAHYRSLGLIADEDVGVPDEDEVAAPRA